MVNPIPQGYRTVTPYLVVDNAVKVIDFVKSAFDAQMVYCSQAPDGTVHHAEIRIGDSMIMLAQAGGPHKPMPSCLYLYVPNVDEVYKQAVKAGGISIMEPKDQFYGDRSGGVTDASGNQWWIGTHIEDVSAEEIERRAKEAGKSC